MGTVKVDTYGWLHLQSMKEKLCVCLTGIVLRIVLGRKEAFDQQVFISQNCFVPKGSHSRVSTCSDK
jgi:hypothetical protein